MSCGQRLLLVHDLSDQLSALEGCCRQADKSHNSRFNITGLFSCHFAIARSCCCEVAVVVERGCCRFRDKP